MNQIKYNIAVDLGGTRIKVGLMNEDSLVSKEIIDADPSGLCANMHNIENTIAHLVQQTQTTHKNITGVGMAFPGIVNPVTKKVLSTNKKYDDAPAIDLEKWVDEKWNAKFYIDNDARMATVGEWKFGAGKGSDNIVMLTIGTGIGSSTIIEGKLLRGTHFQAGCLGGHFIVDHKGNLCSCGNIGCVEAQASTWSIVQRAKNDNGFKKSMLSKIEKIDFQAVFNAAGKNDLLAIDLKHECMDIWAAGIINLIHAYDPEVVILGGGILNSKDEILPYISERVNKYAWTPWGQVELKASVLMSSAALLGVNYSMQHNL